ncbi:hypothetical protein ASE21_00105 [Flavobacterium sp. Root901]|uniref:hypothetical protein n=1 Tax=Flavobacterium sp. Root901 TaxID=1736605 RepID=UPI00070D85CF|nr:hypothetical protein [Flavobacterium sp. Root901]KRD12360.1 hypothetical protein ASE21_00105 [Flavobacterium sp. Root901]
MENLINTENLEEIREIIEDKIADIPGHYILCGALGTLLLSTYLEKTGKKQAASVIAKLSIPIIGIGLAKYKDVIKSKIQEQLDEFSTNNDNTDRVNFGTSQS